MVHEPAKRIFENFNLLTEKSKKNRCGSVVVSTSALDDRVLSSRPGPGMGMFGVRTWLSTLETVYLS